MYRDVGKETSRPHYPFFVVFEKMAINDVLGEKVMLTRFPPLRAIPFEKIKKVG